MPTVNTSIEALASHLPLSLFLPQILYSCRTWYLINPDSKNLRKGKDQASTQDSRATMSVIPKLLSTLMILSAIMIYLTYTPSDSTYFWIYWCAIFVFLAFANIITALFSADLMFVYDPSFNNWQRKTDPLA